jgi:hypothetical protein
LYFPSFASEAASISQALQFNKSRDVSPITLGDRIMPNKEYILIIRLKGYDQFISYAA